MSRAALFENILQIFCSSNREAVAWSFNFQLPEYGWNDMRSRRSFLLDSVCYHGDVMTILNFNWFNLKILMSGRYRKLTSSCVSFTIYQQCHGNIEGDATPISLQYQNIQWESVLKRVIKLKFSNSLRECFRIKCMNSGVKHLFFSWWYVSLLR